MNNHELILKSHLLWDRYSCKHLHTFFHIMLTELVTMYCPREHKHTKTLNDLAQGHRWVRKAE